MAGFQLRLKELGNTMWIGMDFFFFFGKETGGDKARKMIQFSVRQHS
jgi:hypothetical protein